MQILTLGIAALLCASPQSVVLKTDAPITDVVAKDLNQDGVLDILASCCEKEDGEVKAKSVAVFLSRGSSFPSKPSYTVPVPNEASILFTTELNGIPPVELAASSGKRTTVYLLGRNQYKVLREVDVSTLLPNAGEGLWFLNDLSDDLDGDGIDEWLLPSPGGYKLVRANGKQSPIKCDVQSEVSKRGNLTVSYETPKPSIFPLGKKGGKEVAFVGRKFIDSFIQGSSSTLRRTPLPFEHEDGWEYLVQLMNMNGDKFPDLIVTQNKTGRSAESITRVYFASGKFKYPEKPTATFKAEDAVSTPLVTDVDGDENLDLLFLKVPIGAKLIINYLIRKKVTLQAEVYLFDGSRYDSKPTFDESLTIEAPSGRERLVYITGDFDGDGRLDLAIGVGGDKLAIHPGDKRKLFSSKPERKIDVKSSGTARTLDLNADGKDDVIIFHPGGKDEKRLDVIIF